MTYLKLMLTFVLFAHISHPAKALGDRTKEYQWANQIIDLTVVGDPQWLVANGKRFLSIYTPATTTYTKGAVILVHDGGSHPDWQHVIHPLRTRLPKEGWMTLSLQMPVLENKAKDHDYIPLFKDVPGRIQAGIDFLSQYKIENIILVGHSLGSSMASDYLAKHYEKRIKAFVGIDMNGIKQPKEKLLLDNVNALFQIKVPILDVYGSRSIDPVLKSVDRRAYVVYQAGHQYSRQVAIDGADHMFQGYEAQLVKAISDWINPITAESSNVSVAK